MISHTTMDFHFNEMHKTDGDDGNIGGGSSNDGGK